ncbi:MAG: hypothetical protein JWO35_328 [Candidatus Saccharibacteria bacterium]|nr:hypothetical protein [Candidatus Saccharibacteria bacterium]
MPNPKEAIVSSALKVGLGITPYVGEIQWQLAGAPGREDFEPLQHLGNVGVPFGSVMMGGIFINELGGVAFARHNLAKDTESQYDKKMDNYIDDLRFVQRMYIGTTMLVGTLASIYAETFDAGTHDPVDAGYGIGATSLALFLYTRIRNRELRQLSAELKAPLSHSVSTSKTDLVPVETTSVPNHRTPTPKATKTSSSSQQRAQARKAQKHSRKRNR